MLLELGADPFLPTSRGESPLIVGTRRGSIESVTTLIECVIAKYASLLAVRGCASFGVSPFA